MQDVSSMRSIFISMERFSLKEANPPGAVAEAGPRERVSGGQPVPVRQQAVCCRPAPGSAAAPAAGRVLAAAEGMFSLA